MAETGPGRDDLRWHRQCIRTVGTVTAGVVLVHKPSLGSRLVHALVKLLAAAGSSPNSAEQPSRAHRQPWGFRGSNTQGQRRGRVESMGGDDRSGLVREREGSRQRRSRFAGEERRLAELQEAGMHVSGSSDSI